MSQGTRDSAGAANKPSGSGDGEGQRSATHEGNLSNSTASATTSGVTWRAQRLPQDPAPSAPLMGVGRSDDSPRVRLARLIAAPVACALPLGAAWWTWPAASGAIADKLFFSCFVVFAVGLAELFLLFIGLAVLGRIDLPKVFQDKDPLPPPAVGEQEPLYVRAVAGRGSVSLSRLQAFLWTLLIMIAYFHQAVRSQELPTVPAELLMIMGISGAVYIAGKQLGKPGDAKSNTSREGS